MDDHELVERREQWLVDSLKIRLDDLFELADQIKELVNELRPKALELPTKENWAALRSLETAAAHVHSAGVWLYQQREKEGTDG